MATNDEIIRAKQHGMAFSLANHIVTDLRTTLKDLELLINLTPTGEARERLTEINIRLMEVESKLPGMLMQITQNFNGEITKEKQNGN